MDTIKDTIQTMHKGLTNPDNKLSLIPNWLSFSRAIGGFVLPIMVYTKTSLPIIIGSVSYLALSDFLDGKAARLLVKEETKEGALLDAVSDKVFSLALIIGILPVLPSFAINGILEGTISIINGKLLSEGGNPKSNLIGKIKIWPLSVALGLGYLGLATKNLNIPSENLLLLSTALSSLTIPLECINVKQYYDNYKETKENNNIEKEENHEYELSDTLEKENTLTDTKEKKYKLNKNNNILMVTPLPQEEKEIKKEKVYKKIRI